MFTNRTFVCFYISRGCLFMGNTIYKNIKEYIEETLEHAGYFD